LSNPISESSISDKKASSAAAASSSSSTTTATSSPSLSSRLESSLQIQSLHNNILLANEELDACKEALRKEKGDGDKMRKQVELGEKRLSEVTLEHRSVIRLYLCIVAS
jgi:hypothetical protein